MQRYENDCENGILPKHLCQGGICLLKKVLHLYCDECGDEVNKLYYFNGGEFCLCCVKEKLEIMEGNNH